MNLSFVASVCAALSLVVLAARVRPQADPDRDAIVALEQDWLAAEHDRATLDRILADDFLHPVPAGVVLTKAQHIDWAVTHPDPIGRLHRFEQLQVRTYTETAIATGVVRSTGGGGADDRSLFTDVFVRRAGRWQAVNAQENALAASAR